MHLTSSQNAKVKEALSLRERREREATGLFLIEGYRELTRFVDTGGQVEQLFFCPELFLGTQESKLIERIERSQASLFSCSDTLFHKLSYRDRPDGLLAVGRQKRRFLPELKQIVASSAVPFLVVAEAIEKPGNLGTILRSCDASGVDALLLVDRCTDLFNPNVVRASVGTLFSVPVIEATSQEALEYLKRASIRVVAATPSAALNYTEANFRQPIAIAVGTEQLGLSALWMEQASVQVRIPMRGMADSLNVAMATTLLLYEGVRQRADALRG